MGDKTGISWCHHTYNRWWGCTKVTQACKFCYAETLSKRTGRIPEGYVVGSPRIKSKTHNLAMLQRWDKDAREAGEMRRVFCHSMSDVFDQEVPDDWRSEEFDWMAQCDNLWFLILTKRPTVPELFLYKYPEYRYLFESRVWLGTSLGSQTDIDMAFEICEAPAKLHWVSYEPAIGPLDAELLPAKLRWLVIGGESGSDRSFNLEWGLDIIHKRESYSWLSIYMKQLGHKALYDDRPYPHTSDPTHGAFPQDWPKELRVREYPI